MLAESYHAESKQAIGNIINYSRLVCVSEDLESLEVAWL